MKHYVIFPVTDVDLVKIFRRGIKSFRIFERSGLRHVTQERPAIGGGAKTAGKAFEISKALDWGAGGLLLDTGSGPSFLPLPAPVLEQVAAGNSEPGVTSLKLPDSQPKPSDASIRETDVEVCFVCKKCRLAFPGEAPLLQHQRLCYGGRPEGRGAFRIVQTGYECQPCGERLKSAAELRRHCDGDAHKSKAPAESPLSHEMEDVVNQITLLAARAKEAVPDAAFGPPDRKRFLPPPDVAAAGH
ncbi:hypothetical protein BDFB_011711 [Asbolus verrucosus]|uniref:C2H2-type domain-containing protein n=1 Tax=Asbolus verrucosus TaxID=1661398 RepID=A0A482VLZ1_ASBVE|nr:hypothetical protein BDFB_011711 [Asbolus verrucosus]